jgi:hypothetical protein
MLVLSQTIDEIEGYLPPAVLRKKLFSKTIISYVNEKTNFVSIPFRLVECRFSARKNPRQRFERLHKNPRSQK